MYIYIFQSINVQNEPTTIRNKFCARFHCSVWMVVYAVKLVYNWKSKFCSLWRLNNIQVFGQCFLVLLSIRIRTNYANKYTVCAVAFNKNQIEKYNERKIIATNYVFGIKLFKCFFGLLLSIKLARARGLIGFLLLGSHLVTSIFG